LFVRALCARNRIADRMICAWLLLSGNAVFTADSAVPVMSRGDRLPRSGGDGE
jgi:hypothetical protein